MMAGKRRVPAESRHGRNRIQRAARWEREKECGGALGQARDSEKQRLCLCCVRSPLCCGLELTGMGDGSGRQWGRVGAAVTGPPMVS